MRGGNRLDQESQMVNYLTNYGSSEIRQSINMVAG